MDRLREELECFGFDDEEDWRHDDEGDEAQQVGPRRGGAKRGARGRCCVTRPKVVGAAAQRCAVAAPHNTPPTTPAPSPQYDDNDTQQANGDDAGGSASCPSPDAAPPADEGPDDLTCAICLGQIAPLDLALVKGCEHQYCGARRAGRQQRGPGAGHPRPAPERLAQQAAGAPPTGRNSQPAR